MAVYSPLAPESLTPLGPEGPAGMEAFGLLGAGASRAAVRGLWRAVGGGRRVGVRAGRWRTGGRARGSRPGGTARGRAPDADACSRCCTGSAESQQRGGCGGKPRRSDGRAQSLRHAVLLLFELRWSAGAHARPCLAVLILFKLRQSAACL